MGYYEAAKKYPNHLGHLPKYPKSGQFSPSPPLLPSFLLSVPITEPTSEPQEAALCFHSSHQPVLSLQSCHSGYLRHKSDYIPQLLTSFQKFPIPLSIKSKPVPESFWDLCQAYPLNPFPVHPTCDSCQTFSLTRNLFPISQFIFHQPRSLFSTINTPLSVIQVSVEVSFSKSLLTVEPHVVPLFQASTT